MARSCPICEKPSASGKVAPFCSDRCQLIDLGKWIGEEYRVASYEPVPEAHAQTVGGAVPSQASTEDGE